MNLKSEVLFDVLIFTSNYTKSLNLYFSILFADSSISTLSVSIKQYLCHVNLIICGTIE